jgi:hypothetical protein
MLASADTRQQRRPGKTAATPRLPPTICTALRCAAPAHAVCLANVGILWVRTWASSRGTGSVLHWRIREIVTGAMSRIVVTLSRKAERKAVVSLHSRRRRSRGREWRQRQGWQGKVDGPWLGITSGGIRCREHLSRLLRAVGAARHCQAMQSALGLPGPSSSHEHEAQRPHPPLAEPHRPGAQQLKHALQWSSSRRGGWQMCW